MNERELKINNLMVKLDEVHEMARELDIPLGIVMRDDKLITRAKVTLGKSIEADSQAADVYAIGFQMSHTLINKFGKALGQ